MIDFKEIPDGDAWEEFCRDYLVALGFVVDIPPGRGPDGGRDLLVKEQLQGILASKSFTWLVSCKHKATSGKSVGLDDEQNITDRLEQHGAEGFIGFYSTIPSASLVERLKELRNKGKIQEFEIYSGSRIENGFHDIGLSGVLLQHLPNSHTVLRPIHPILGKYEPLHCEVCGTDLLKESIRGKKLGNIIFAHPKKKIDDTELPQVTSIHFACKDKCDETLEKRLHKRDLYTGWDDLSDYCNPLIFLRRLVSHANQMRYNPNSYSDAAHKQMITLYIILSQRTLRQTNKEDPKAFRDAIFLDNIYEYTTNTL